MTAFDDAPLIAPRSRAAWRAWLEANHATVPAVWLVMPRETARRRPPADGDDVLDYTSSVEEALCFGWVDSRAGTVDETRTKLYFAPRKPTSAWARTNKERVERLIATGRMAPAGLAAIERAKANGSWTVLDSVERGEVPDDLAAALDARPPARERWDAFTPSRRKELLTSIAIARRPETRARRVLEAAEAARENRRAIGDGVRAAD
jgi:uncharacterized protein YdeI (YjbR/CyaY-like superfamily)